MEALKRIPLKLKIIIGVIGSAFSIIFMIIILLVPLIKLGIIDASAEGSNSLGYSNVGSSNGFWWPIGSKETSTENNITYATGTPMSTVISSNYGMRIHPITGVKKLHTGLDIGSNGNSSGVINVIAAKSGTVTYPTAGDRTDCPTSNQLDSCGGGYGNYVMIEHEDGTITLYAHLYENSIKVKAGDTVKQGQVIAKMGSSGNSTGTHLHFEIRVNGSTVDPLNYISADNPRPTASTGAGTVTGNSNMQTICLSLKENGYSDIAVAGIMGNMDKESGYDPNAKNELGCLGIVQWCDRKTNLINTYGSNWNKLENQIEFVLYELNHSEKAAQAYLQNPNIGVRDMAYKFCNGYERPGVSVCQMTDVNHDRMGSAEQSLSYVKNGCK